MSTANVSIPTNKQASISFSGSQTNQFVVGDSTWPVTTPWNVPNNDPDTMTLAIQVNCKDATGKWVNNPNVPVVTSNGYTVINPNDNSSSQIIVATTRIGSGGPDED